MLCEEQMRGEPEGESGKLVVGPCGVHMGGGRAEGGEKWM